MQLEACRNHKENHPVFPFFSFEWLLPLNAEAIERPNRG